MRGKLPSRLVAEFLGTMFLVAAVVGSGIMAERLAGGNVALALLANTIATGAALVALILAFGPISGAHLNPAVSLAMGVRKMMEWSEVPLYVTAQFTGGWLGTLLAHAMFARPLFSISHHPRAGWPQLISEFVATFGLLSVIWGCLRIKSAMAIPLAVGAYITAAYWFTASTSFANPAVTLARSMTDSFTGIRPIDVLPFMAAEVAGAISATWLFEWLEPSSVNEPLQPTPSLSPSPEAR
ncbi:MAG: MIP/aquaporin family protein [Terriglobales bacterium]